MKPKTMASSVERRSDPFRVELRPPAHVLIHPAHSCFVDLSFFVRAICCHDDLQLVKHCGRNARQNNLLEDFPHAKE